MRSQVTRFVLFATLFLVSAACSIGSQNTSANPISTLRPTISTQSTGASTGSARSTAASGPSVTATAAGLGKILFQDDFSDPASGWLPADLGEIVFGYDSGVYRIVLNKSGLNSHALLPSRRFDNVSIEADAKFIAGPTDGIFGILCRATATTVLQTGYEFLITANGAAGMVKVTGPNAGESKLVGQVDKSDAIHTGNATNHLRADCSGSNLALYVNGQKLVAEQDGDFQEGQVGFAISTPANNSGYEVHFDNFVVREATP